MTGLCFALGLLLAGSVLTVSSVHRAGGGVRVGVPPATGARTTETVKKLTDTVKKLETEIGKLRDDKTKLEMSLAQGDNQAKALNDVLQKTKMLAGLLDTEGKGVVLVLNDSQKRRSSVRAFDADKFIIHDVDLQQVVNEMLASGAEAIGINGQRMIGRTSIRCVGPTIQVNGVPISPPFTVSAIGPPETLAGGLNLPGGVLDGLRTYDPDMFKLEKHERVVLPAYAGSTELRYSMTRSENASGSKSKLPE